MTSVTPSKAVRKLSMFCFVLLIAVVAAAVHIGGAEQYVITDASSAARMAWVDETWSNNDPAYRNARSAIDYMTDHGKLTKQYWQKFYTAALQNKQDPLTQFKWAYATYQAARSGVQFDSVTRLRFQVNEALANVKSPRNYEFARVKFLIAMSHNTNYAYQNLGRRLLKRDVKDRDVKYHFIDTLNLTKPKEAEEALRCAKELVRDYPKRPGCHGALASVYLSKWNSGHRSEDANAAIVEYQRVIQLTPNTPDNARYIRNAQFLISDIQRVRARLRK